MGMGVVGLLNRRACIHVLLFAFGTSRCWMGGLVESFLVCSFDVST